MPPEVIHIVSQGYYICRIVVLDND